MGNVVLFIKWINRGCKGIVIDVRWEVFFDVRVEAMIVFVE